MEIISTDSGTGLHERIRSKCYTISHIIDAFRAKSDSSCCIYRRLLAYGDRSLAASFRFLPNTDRVCAVRFGTITDNYRTYIHGHRTASDGYRLFITCRGVITDSYRTYLTGIRTVSDGYGVFFRSPGITPQCNGIFSLRIIRGICTLQCLSITFSFIDDSIVCCIHRVGLVSGRCIRCDDHGSILASLYLDSLCTGGLQP